MTDSPIAPPLQKNFVKVEENISEEEAIKIRALQPKPTFLESIFGGGAPEVAKGDEASESAADESTADDPLRHVRTGAEL